MTTGTSPVLQMQAARSIIWHLAEDGCNPEAIAQHREHFIFILAVNVEHKYPVTVTVTVHADNDAIFVVMLYRPCLANVCSCICQRK
jgi:hypothetical protein